MVWTIGITTGLVFLVQTLLAFTGINSSNRGMGTSFVGGFNADAGQRPFRLFTFRNSVNFLLGFSWTILSLHNLVSNQLVLIVLGVIAGALWLAAMRYLFFAMGKLQPSGTVDIQQAVGKTAETYLTVPGFKNGMGKVHVRMKGALRELDAVTEGETIPSGTSVKIIRVVEGRVLLVGLA